MKVFDATSLIAFLSEMNYPEGLVELSKYYKLIVPTGVALEIIKPHTKSIFNDLVSKKILLIVKVDPDHALTIQNENPQLHIGECEVIAFAIEHSSEKAYLLSDDLKARKLFKNLNFKWTEEVMQFMKERNIIDNETYNKRIEVLKKSTFHYKGKSK